jgi:hypothetical protein
MRVKLVVDLTRYDRRLIVGELGETCDPQSGWARSQPDSFVGVRFDNGACRDILWKSLEVLGPDPEADPTNEPPETW